MKNSNIRLSSPSDNHFEEFTTTEMIFLEWIEIIIAVVCFVVLVYTLFLCPSSHEMNLRYAALITTEIILLLIAIILYRKKKLTFSSNVLILAGIIGPWWSAIIDTTLIEGNLFPLVYITVPILFSSFFSPVSVSIFIGTIQIIGLAVFIYYGNFNLSLGASSLFIFVVFIFAISLIINIQNKNNRRTISEQVEKLREYAIRDPLTGLYNRRFPIEFLEKEFAKLERSGGTLSIMVLDVDDFKHFNDTYGHDFGDEILVFISDLIKENFRKSDVSCRFGGDEFFVVMNGTKPNEAKRRGETLRKLIVNKEFNVVGEKEKRVTISIGIAAYPEHGKTVDEVLKAADLALYKAKEMGKNRTEVMDRSSA